MSEQNVDIIRRSWSAWMERDMDRAAAEWHPDIVWDITRHEDAPDTVHHGVAEVMEMIASWMCCDRLTGENVDRFAAHVWTVRDAKVVYIRSYSDIEEGRREAAVAAPPA
jgi:ketosteroid isomerase-like protein